MVGRRHLESCILRADPNPSPVTALANCDDWSSLLGCLGTAGRGHDAHFMETMCRDYRLSFWVALRS